MKKLTFGIYDPEWRGYRSPNLPILLDNKYFGRLFISKQHNLICVAGPGDGCANVLKVRLPIDSIMNLNIDDSITKTSVRSIAIGSIMQFICQFGNCEKVVFDMAAFGTNFDTYIDAVIEYNRLTEN